MIEGEEKKELPLTFDYSEFLRPILRFLIFGQAYVGFWLLRELVIKGQGFTILFYAIAELVLFYFFFQFKGLSRIKILMDENSFKWVDHLRELEISYHEIKEIRFNGNQSKSSFSLVLIQGGELHIYPYISRPRELFEHIRERRPELFKPEVEQHIQAFDNTSTSKNQLSHSFEFKNYFNRFIFPMIGFSVVMAVGYLLYLWLGIGVTHPRNLGTSFGIQLIHFGLIVSLTWSFHVGFVGRKIEWMIEDGYKEEDKQVPNKAFFGVLRGYSIFYLFVFVVYATLDFNKSLFLQLSSDRGELPYFGNGEKVVTFVYDLRVGCQKCKKSLEEGDFFLAQNPTNNLGKVVLGRVINSDSLPLGQGRAPASTALPVLNIETGERTYLDPQMVLGKIVSARPQGQLEHPISEWIKPTE